MLVTQMTAQEVAEVLKISDHMVYKLVKQKKIPHNRIGCRVVFDPNELEKWLIDNRSGVQKNGRKTA